MEQPELSRDSHVVLLLASHLGGNSNDKGSDNGLGPAGWKDFTNKINNSTLDSPGSLLELPPEEWPADIWTSQADQEWVTQRLNQSTQLAMALEKLNNKGIWVTTLYETSYPAQLANTLKRKAPPFLYVAGKASHLKTTGVGFVGSRDADETDRGYTRRLVEKVVDDGFSIVSGGAKGIDETAEDTGLKHGGPVVEFPAEGIQNSLQDETVREAVMQGQLTLASHYHPESSWNVGAAMGRNKLIHGFGEYTIVVRSGNGTGGTWEGATENIDNGWSKLLICSHSDAPPGNKALIEKGGIPINPTGIPEEDSLDEWVRGLTGTKPKVGGSENEPDGDEANMANEKKTPNNELEEADDTQSSLGEFN